MATRCRLPGRLRLGGFGRIARDWPEFHGARSISGVSKVMYREIVDWAISNISAQISSVILLRAYPQATISASLSVSSRGRPIP